MNVRLAHPYSLLLVPASPLSECLNFSWHRKATDPVYEGKSMAGMIDLVARGEIDRGARVLYAHLGGQPALNAYGALFRD